ncbi:aromatic acid exporter family protein [Streptomyces sp. NPDC049954]|uniref:FUSC family protein n=1 Tax=Streptomyces sp. NPDC049954 TaxID=3155779 RepID=UPI00344A8340
MPEVPAPVVALVRRTTEPVVAQTIRSTAAAVVSYVIATLLLPQPAPLTAPLTALLVVQVTLYATLKTGIRRVNAVLAGVLIATGFSALVGLTWWTLGLTILTALVIGRVVRVGEFVPEVAISAMLVLGVAQVTATALDRVFETLIGAVVGLVFNSLAPPVWVQSAGDAITGMASSMGRLYRDMAEEVTGHVPVAEAAQRLHAARRLDDDISEVDAELRQAEDSTRLNPRVKEGLLSRVALRTGLDTLEICAVVQRVQFRSLTDLAKARPDEAMLPDDAAQAYAQLLRHTAEAVESFATLITTSAASGADAAEDSLEAALTASRADRDRLADRLLDLVREQPRQWQLHGALLAEADRVLDELDVEKRSARLIEELDRLTARTHERRPRLQAVLDRLRTRRS